MPSSMETVPTDMVDGFGSDDDATEGPGVWGRLFPIGSSFTALGFDFCIVIFSLTEAVRSSISSLKVQSLSVSASHHITGRGFLHALLIP